MVKLQKPSYTKKVGGLVGVLTAAWLVYGNPDSDSDRYLPAAYCRELNAKHNMHMSPKQLADCEMIIAENTLAP